MVATSGQALSKLLFFLVFLPASLTYFHLRFASHRANLCFVAPATGTLQVNHMYGIYQGLSRWDESSHFHLVSGLSTHQDKWPSIAQVSTMLATPTSLLLRGSLDHLGFSLNQISYDQNKWCLESTTHKLCSAPTRNSFAPVSGVWSDEAGNSVQVSHQGPEDRESSYDKYATERLEYILLRPVTSLLVALNCLLAFVYWSGHVKPSNVAKIYDKIVVQGELWRAFSGATAHFDPLHLCFNLVSLYSLGTMLEGSYGSIPFLFYNVSLIAITTMIMTVIVNIYMKRTGSTVLRETSTVGFSGVLFAWMVVATLESPETCPIPFLPTVCFRTFEFWRFRFNAGVVIQMCIAQVIMRRASFEGHLAGVFAGFALHWKLLPLELVQPALLLPALHLAHLWHWCRLVPVTGRNECDDNYLDTREGDIVDLNGRFDSRRYKRERDERTHRMLVHVRNALVVMVVLSLFYDIFALGLGLVFFHFCVQSHALLMKSSGSSAEYIVEKGRLGTLWKGFILSCVLTIVYDSMSLAGWIVARDLWNSTSGCSIELACVVLLVRLSVQIVALTLASQSLSGIGETGGGIFVVVFGPTVLESTRSLKIQKSQFTAFGGRGHTLGGGEPAAETPAVLV